MATHSSVLAWRIPGTAERGGLPSMGSHRVRHDWSDLAAVAAAGQLSAIVLCCAVLSCFSRAWLCDPMDHSPPAPLSMGFYRQKYRYGLPCACPGKDHWEAFGPSFLQVLFMSLYLTPLLGLPLFRLDNHKLVDYLFYLIKFSFWLLQWSFPFNYYNV